MTHCVNLVSKKKTLTEIYTQEAFNDITVNTLVESLTLGSLIYLARHHEQSPTIVFKLLNAIIQSADRQAIELSKKLSENLLPDFNQQALKLPERHYPKASVMLAGEHH